MSTVVSQLTDMINHPAKPAVSVGCQGGNYSDWISKAGGEAIFYPRGTRTDEMLALYAKVFNAVEVDSTFYGIPPLSAIENWFQKTPENFLFFLKLPQEITHRKALRETSFPLLDSFCERAGHLKEKLGGILIQLPPQFAGSKENARALRNFFRRLPENLRFAVEFRHQDWLIDWTFAELEKNGVTLCLVEGNWLSRETMFQAIEKLKNDFAYVRFMGKRDLTTFDRIYRVRDSNLLVWKEEILKIQAREIFVSFSNFYEGHAPASANKLKKLLGQEIIEAGVLENQGSLF